MHPIHRRYYAEDLVRLRRADSPRRRVAAQRRSRVDANPHQIEAVMFALRRIPEGGCILADEVGLGKTIEAGLVIAQLLAEGKERILILLPRPLLGQWSDELRDLFGIDAVEASDPGVDLRAPGVVLAGREYAGGERGAERLGQAAPFDLCLIDEAHEVFAGLHRRFRRDGSYDEDSPHARTAHRVRRIIGISPVLLLTATPIQNSLSEMWSLVQYIDRTGTLLGDKPTFEELFDRGSGGRRISEAQANELQRRLGVVVQRTLRRQAVEYLERPFVGRQARLFRYRMSPDEKSLYDDVTEYLLRPQLLAFRGRARQLQLIGFHRRMASSIAALARSLEGVARRLRGLLRSGGGEDDAADLADLEEVNEPIPSIADEDPGNLPALAPEAALPSPAAVERELGEIEDFIARARALPEDSKAESLLRAVELMMDRPADRRKLLIFTESLTTQEYLRDLLVGRSELEEADITLFRGVNDSPRAAEALRVWREEVESEFPEYRRPSPSVAVRLALVHEFRTRSTVMIASEAGAKGLNLQFCDTVVNYDLPWNPQRIEQRIGRCHRYGQKRDVTVINFLAEDNEAQRLTFDILSSKLDLFGKVLDRSDVVLQTPRSDASETLASALGPDFESQLRRIWDRARSVEEVEAELRRLREDLEERRRELDRVRERAMGLIERRLDASVRQVFDEIRSGLGPALTELDGDLERVLSAYLEDAGAAHGVRESEERRVLHFGASGRLPTAFRNGGSVVVGDARGLPTADPLHLGHPLIRAAVDDVRRRCAGAFRVAFRLRPTAPASLRDRRGSRGRLALTRVRYAGFEDEERLRATVVFDDAEVLRPGEAAMALLRQPCVDTEELSPPLAVSEADLDEVVEEELFEEHGRVAAVNQQSFEQSIGQLDQYLEDRMLVLRRDRQRAGDGLAAAERERDGSMGADPRAGAEARVRRLEQEVEGLDSRIAELAAREDATYRLWKTHATERRYAPPSGTRLLSAEFVIE